VSSLASTLAVIWRLASPFFRSEDRVTGRILLGSVIAIELSIVTITVMMNLWYNRFYNALQDRNWDAFVNELIFFCVLAASFIVLAVYQLYLNQWLQIRWRRWMTRAYVDDWLAGANHYRMQVLGDQADNPDQRIAEDIRLFIELAMSIGIGLLSSVVTLGSFVVILWTLSAQAPLHLFGTTVSIPGYLVWAALAYAVVGTTLTHLIGRPLIALNFRQQRFEADFRFNLVRVRENSEQIALLHGEHAESERLIDRFGRVVANWYAIMLRQKKLTFFTASYSQISVIVPYIVVSPAYFAGAIPLGGLMQTANAFNSVQTALSFFVSAYRQIAEWRAVIERLDGFKRAIGGAQQLAKTPPLIEIDPRDGQNAVEIDDLLVNLPNGVPLVAVDNVVVHAGERVLLTGPTGAGKSSLFRAISGIWPFGSGTVTVPRGARIMMLPQRPYFPIAPLGAAVSYPSDADAYDPTRLAEAISAVGLPALAQRLDEESHWNHVLSPGEQQRLGIARALLHAPDFLFLDEATASLDEPSEAALYNLVHARLKGATIISIGHRGTLRALHDRKLRLIREGDRFQVTEGTLEPAAQ
jgi:putative ATP-binding cassette transporter